MLDIYFLTSNRAKFDHIKYLLREYAINIKPQLNYGKAYSEPRIFDRNEILEASIKDANTRLSKKIKHGNKSIIQNGTEITIDEIALRNQEKLFIIEDTSIRIDALSKDTEFPGVDVKYWMREIDFDTLNQQLLNHGNNRQVTVRSDIVIYLPPSFRENNDTGFLKIFTGTTSGYIAENEEDFNTNPIYPWLDNKSFNKWFNPGNEKKPLSMLPIDVANLYDFRKKAIDQLVSYLKENTLTTLLKPQKSRTPYQTSFFDKPNLIICGPTCAGKTILADFLSEKYGHYHIEASDFMHLAYYRKHGYTSSVSIHDFALNALKENPSIVSEQINDHLDFIGNLPCIITGFRSPDELAIFATTARTFHHAYINASLHSRYKRNENRARHGHAKSFEEFESQDLKQMKMGLDRIKLLEKFQEIENESTIGRYLSEASGIFFSKTENPEPPTKSRDAILDGSNLSLEESILISLLIESEKDTRYFTTTEIAKLINNSLSSYRHHNQVSIETNKNNVSRYFNQHLYPYYEVKVVRNTATFKLSTTGISHTKHLLQMISSRKN